MTFLYSDFLYKQFRLCYYSKMLFDSSCDKPNMTILWQKVMIIGCYGVRMVRLCCNTVSIA